MSKRALPLETPLSFPCSTAIDMVTRRVSRRAYTDSSTPVSSADKDVPISFRGSHIYRSARFRLTHCVAKDRNFPVYSFQQSDLVRVPVRTPQSQSVRLRLVQRHFCQNFSQPVASSTHLSSGYVCLSNDGISSCNEFCSDTNDCFQSMLKGFRHGLPPHGLKRRPFRIIALRSNRARSDVFPTVAHVHVLHLFQFHFTVTGQLTSRPFFWEFCQYQSRSDRPSLGRCRSNPCHLSKVGALQRYWSYPCHLDFMERRRIDTGPAWSRLLCGWDSSGLLSFFLVFFFFVVCEFRVFAWSEPLR